MVWEKLSEEVVFYEKDFLMFVFFFRESFFENGISIYGVGGFMFYGFVGILVGVVICFYVFVGFDCIVIIGKCRILVFCRRKRCFLYFMNVCGWS